MINLMEYSGNLLNEKMQRCIKRNIEKNFDVEQYCGIKIHKRSKDTIVVWVLLKDVEKNYRIAYVQILFDVENETLRNEAILNSPKINDIHEVVSYNSAEDVVHYYIDNIGK